MRSLRFWKRESKTEDQHAEAPVVGKFGIAPRTDLGAQSLPADPDLAARAAALQKRRKALEQELRVAGEAAEPDNQWRHQAALISEALEAIKRDHFTVSTVEGVTGAPMPPVPVTGVAVTMDPVASVRFRIGDTEFVYAEELDWAERGTQIARSDLHRESGDVASLIPPDYPSDQRAALLNHLEGSLFTFATDLRDRAIDGRPPPSATLSDLAKPSTEFGGWLDWSGNSPIAQARQIDLNRLREEQERLEAERSQLLDEEARLLDAIPVIRRRLVDVEQQLAALTSQGR